MIHIVLFQPEIPPNTGNIIRLAANTGARLHLIEPLGFELDEKRVRRAGLDYHELSEVHRWPDWDSFSANSGIARVFAFSTKATTLYTNARFQDGDGLLFGPETRGLPATLRDSFAEDRKLRLPMRPDSRSLNLSNTVAIALYEALRQTGFAQLG